MSSLTTALAGINIPNISEEDLANPQTVRQILEYLIILNRDLKFFLSHLDMDNFTAEFQQTINEATEGMTEIVQTMTNLEQGLASTRKQTAEGFLQMVTKGEFNSFAQQTADGFSQTVSKGTIISEINQSAEAIRIRANKIEFEGTVTANNNFAILQDGSIFANNGIFSGEINGESGSIGPFDIGTNGIFVAGQMAYFSNMEDGVTWGNAGGIRNNSDNLQITAQRNLIFYTPSGIFTGDVTIAGNLSVTGTKNSLVDTPSHGPRLLNAYETAEYYFADIGECSVENGVCIILIEPIYHETVNTDIPYQIKLTPYGDGRIWVAYRKPTFFVVMGDDIPFGWEIAAKRRGYEEHRLMQPNI